MLIVLSLGSQNVGELRDLNRELSNLHKASYEIDARAQFPETKNLDFLLVFSREL